MWLASEDTISLTSFLERFGKEVLPNHGGCDGVDVDDDADKHTPYAASLVSMPVVGGGGGLTRGRSVFEWRG